MTGLIRVLSRVKEDLQSGQHVVQGYISLWRIVVFITGALVVNVCEGRDAMSFFSPRFTNPTPLYIFAIQAVCAMMMYQSCKKQPNHIHVVYDNIMKFHLIHKDKGSGQLFV